MLFADPVRWIDPRTWPWIIYVWIAMFSFGWLKQGWLRLQRYQQQEWPSASGIIESADITAPKTSFFKPKGRSPQFQATVRYSYSVAGASHKGEHTRDFYTQPEAQEFLRDLQGKPVLVNYNPANPTNSTLTQPAIDALLQNRAAASDAASLSLSSVGAIPQWLNPFIWFFVALSAIGFVISLWIHIGAIVQFCVKCIVVGLTP